MPADRPSSAPAPAAMLPHVEPSLRAREQVDFQAAFEAFCDPALIAGAIRDDTGRIEDFGIRWVNTAWCQAVAKTLGRPALEVAELIGHRLYEVFPPGRERAGLHRKVVDEHVVLNAIAWAADHWEELRFSPYGDGFIMLARDVTDRVEADDARRAAAAEMAALISLSPDAIAVHEDGIITFVNEAAVALLGADGPDQLLGRPALEFIAPERRELSAARTQRLAGGGSPAIRAEQTYVRLDGSTVEV